VTVKEVKRKDLPELDDDFAVEAAGFDSMDELRADIRKRLEEGDAAQIDNEYREAVLDAAVANATIDVPDALVAARASELFEQTIHSLGHRGIDRDTYLRITGKTEEELLEDAKPDAEQSLRRDAVLTAVVAAESIEVSEDEVLEVIVESGGDNAAKPKKALDRLRSEGRLDSLKQDLAARKALDLIVAEAKPVEAGQPATSE
jgi:trigger factor